MGWMNYFIGTIQSELFKPRIRAKKKQRLHNLLSIVNNPNSIFELTKKSDNQAKSCFFLDNEFTGLVECFAVDDRYQSKASLEGLKKMLSTLMESIHAIDDLERSKSLEYKLSIKQTLSDGEKDEVIDRINSELKILKSYPSNLVKKYNIAVAKEVAKMLEYTIMAREDNIVAQDHRRIILSATSGDERYPYNPLQMSVYETDQKDLTKLIHAYVLENHFLDIVEKLLRTRQLTEEMAINANYYIIVSLMLVENNLSLADQFLIYLFSQKQKENYEHYRARELNEQLFEYIGKFKKGQTVFKIIRGGQKTTS